MPSESSPPRRRRTYAGRRRADGTPAVTVDTRPLDSRLDLRQHGPDGFDWGYGETGAAQLALAILADYLGDDEQALAVYRHFKRKVVWHLPPDRWSLSEREIEAALSSIQAQTARERLLDRLGVVMKTHCITCGRIATFWAPDRQAVVRKLDEAGWSEYLKADGEVGFRCSECAKPPSGR